MALSTALSSSPLAHYNSVRLSTEICCIILKNERKLMFYAILLHQLKAFESFFTMNELFFQFEDDKCTIFANNFTAL